MALAAYKDIRRSIAKSLGRFLAIAGIAALGTGFYAGLRMTAPDMYQAADEFYDANHFMDLRIVSTLGLTDDDVTALHDVTGVEHVMPGYETDIMGTINGEQYSIRVHSLPAAALASEIQDGTTSVSSDDAYLNRIILTEGRWPEAQGECVISSDRVMNNPTNIGDTVTVTQCSQTLEDTLKTTEYTIVGYVNTPYYVCSSNLGTTTLGSGTLEQYMYVPESDFVDDLPYTEVFVTFEGATQLQNASPEYNALIKRMTNRVEDMGMIQADRRTAETKGKAQEELDKQWAEFNSQKDEAMAQLNNAKAQLDAAASQLSEGRAQVQAGEYAYNLIIEQYNIMAPETRAALETRIRELESAIALLEDASGAIPPQYQERYNELMATLQQSRDELTQAATSPAAQEALDRAQAQLNDARAQLAQGQAQYNSAYAQYNASYATVTSQLADAERQLNDAQAQIDAMQPAEWYLLDRTKNFGAESFRSDAGRVDNIARVFPFIFFLVAALVSLTTMTRMVEEERVVIGTYKALGYSTARIASKYLIYAAIASVSGSIIGIAIMSQLLPSIIMAAYQIIYTVPTILPQPLDIPLALLAAGLGVGITLLATYGAVVATLREKPASLMLPRAPKAGKRILLERIGAIWSRTSFSWKVTFRNMFRYKKRFLMTVIGIAGCTALLLTGLGLRNSINDIIDNHFGRIILYNAIVSTEEGLAADDHNAIDVALAEDEKIESHLWVEARSMLATPEGTANLVVNLIVPQDVQAFENFVHLQNRVTGEPCSLEDGGAVVSEKLANRLGLQVGDTIALHEQDAIGNAMDAAYEFEVAGIAENYVLNYVYVAPNDYQRVWKEAPDYATALVTMTTDEAARSAWSEDMRALPGVKTVGFNDETIQAYRTMLRSVDMIVWVLVIAAAALAFIVLYNLTNINITERQREIATLKVLGFTPREVQAYIYREIAILSIIGAALGLILGIFMEDFIVVTAEVDQVMFGREIHPDSFVIAFLLTLVFTAFVMLVMRHKLSAVNMVESLKSVE